VIKKISSKDLKIWKKFTKHMGNVANKDLVTGHMLMREESIYILDLHGYSLNEANTKVKNCINKFYEKGQRYIKIITGKGTRSKNIYDPYQSDSLSILKNSVPEFIKNNQELMNKILQIKQAKPQDGGEGAFYLLLKKAKE
tara:strand:+ start:455 stop:877 length:423 start_codon:yes stop_codon:yes gene_type:complete